MPPANIVVVDESHHLLATSHRQLIERLPDALVLGFTATPFRSDGRGLGDIFTHLVEIATPSQLTELGILVPPRVFAPSAPDLVGVRTTAGDYNKKDLVLRVDTPRLIGSVAEHWGRIVRGRTAVAFASSIEHSRHLAQALCGVGARAVHMDADTDVDVRKTYLDLLAQGELDVITNVGILCEGWDQPSLGAVIVARPTQSCGLWIQMCGRGARAHEGKSDYLLVDHAGNVLRHGFPDEDRAHSLEATPRRQAASLKTCPHCFLVVSAGTSSCPGCHFALGSGLGGTPDRTPEVIEGDLIELHDRPPLTPSPKILQRQDDYLRWRAEAWLNGWKPGYAAHRYHEKYGIWPVKAITAAWSESRALELVAELNLLPRRARMGPFTGA
jgi:superfamily II DNA or RNA helicase